MSSYNKEYYEANKEKFKEYSKKYKANRSEEAKEKVKKSNLKFYYNNKDKYVAYRNQEHVKAKQKICEVNYKSDRKNYLKVCLINLRARAKKRGLDFNLDIEDIKTPAYCPILKIPLIIKEYSTTKGFSPNSPSVDRIDNNRGYLKDNVQVVSCKANSMKNNATPEELLQFAYWVILTYGHLIDKEIS